ncbi:MAG TPA: GTPase ObgE [Actinomycetota bacterium]|nr:GTPase ObgE [Actinomycetota bacterium]
MTFVDEVDVEVRAGRGGDGSAAMRSEPYKPKGGPEGGDGGRGGDVVFRATRNLHDLAWFADHPHLRAEPGTPGARARRDGGNGKDLVVAVPDGTVVFDEQGLIADLVGEGAEAVVAKGGRGGRGNTRFAGPKNRVPRTAEAGEEGEERRLHVELRTVADLGLVGLPNAGKSTLLAKLTAATPKIADYPFTTLTPNLGVADAGDDRFVVADIPGLVEGAHQGKGLGHRFLRHVTRCRALVLVVDLSSPDAPSDLETVRAELRAYDPELAERPSLVVGTKADLVEDPARAADEIRGLPVSAVTGEGLELLATQLEQLSRQGAAELPPRAPYVVLRPGRARFTISRESGGWRVVGRNVERWVHETDLDDERALVALQRKLIKEGVERQLAKAGARRGDEIRISDRTFEFLPEVHRPEVDRPEVDPEQDRREA